MNRSSVTTLPPSLRKNFSWTFIGNLFFAGCQWSVLSLFAKLTNPETVGKFALAQGIVLPLMMIANFNIGVMLVTDTHRRYRFESYRSARFVLLAVTFFLIVLVTRLSKLSAEMTLLTLLLGIAQGTDCFSELYFSLMQRAELMSKIATSLIARGAISLGAAVVMLYETRSVLWAAAALAVGRLAVLFTYDLRMKRRLESGVPQTTPVLEEREIGYGKWEAACAIAKTAFPLAAVSFMSSLMINMPRYFIERYCGHRQLGVYAAMWSLLTGGNMIAIALGQALFPRLARLYATADIAGYKKFVWRSLHVAVGLGLAGTGIAAIGGKSILLLVYRPEYAARYQLFTALMAVGGLIYIVTLLGYVATAAKSFRSQALLMGIVVGTTAIACFLLIPRFALQGAVLAVGIGAITQIGGLVIIVHRLLGKFRMRSVGPLLRPGAAEA